MWEALQAISLQLGAACWSLVLVLKWLHSQFVQPTGRVLADTLLPVWEESLRAFVRESFATLSRNLNTFSAFVLSLLSGRSYRRTAARSAARKQQAWHRWWQQARGTFNALIEQEGLAPGEADSGLSPPVTPRSAQWRLGGLGSGPLPTSGSSSSASSRWRVWRRRGSAHEAGLSPSVAQADRQRLNGELRHGSALFELPSAFSITQMIDSRGLLEEWRLGCEVAVGRTFGAARRFLHRLLWLDEGGSSSGRYASSREGSPADLLERRMRRSTPPPHHLPGIAEEAAAAGEAAAAATGSAVATGAGAAVADSGASAAARRPGRRRIPLRNMLRSGRHWEEDLSVWTASDVILREGYPLEQHSVTTPDGYVLQVQRIPRHGARDVVFFQHGVLDTSLGWVSNGVVGSAAFAAYDAGFDVWLGNSRSNAPRLHVDSDRQGSRYWLYSINELGVYDIGAVVTHIHNTKMAELANPGRHSAAAQEAPAQQAGQLRRSGSDSQLHALRWVDVRSGSSRGDLETASSSRLSGEHACQKAAAAAWGREAEVAASVGQQPEGQVEGSQEGEQPWWQRLSNSLSTTTHQEAAIAPVAGGAAPLRRVQSAPEPLPTPGQEGAAHYAVPVRMRLRQPQQQRGTGSSSKSTCSKAQRGKSESAASATSGSSAAAAGGPQEVLPYRLQAVAHSLGAACVIMYAVVCRMRGQPHRLRRLVLMSPAGFHTPLPAGMLLFKYLFPPLIWLLDRTPLLRGHGLGMRLPSPLLRYITFKFSKDLRHMPALQDLVAAFMRAMTGGDTSHWQAALQMPHYSAFAMPALSAHCGAHFAQWAKDPSFRLYDYGSKAANRRHYGTDRPPSLAAEHPAPNMVTENYRLLDIPVDVLAGGADGVIPPAAVLHHVRHLRTAGVPCSFRILPYGHMDLVMAVKDDIRMYVLSKLRNPLP